MKVWIFNPYGNLPGEGWSPYRSTSIARALTKRGHEVVWWVSDFEHRSKKQRECGSIDYGDGFSVRILRSSPYKRHISWARIRFERNYAKSLCRAIRGGTERPDVIVHCEPAVCFSDISMKAVRWCGVPLIIDVIDLWPELFRIAFPPLVRPFSGAFLAPLYAKRRHFYRRADGFLAVAKNYLQLAQRLQSGMPGAVAYLGTDIKAYGAAPTASMALPAKTPGDVWCVYVGTLGRNYDVTTLLRCSEKLAGRNIKILVAGDGDLRSQFEHASEGGVIVYLGRVSFDFLTALYPYCDIALACYAPGSTVSMPFKAFDYLAAGLPIVTSLDGDLGEFVRTERIGLRYTAGDADSLLAAILKLAEERDMRVGAKCRAQKLGQTMDYDVQYAYAADLIEKVAATKIVASSSMPNLNGRNAD